MKQLFCCAWLVAAFTMAMNASVMSENKLTFAVNDDGATATVTGHEGNLAGELIIPATTVIDGTTYAVTVIGDEAFGGCGGLTSVTFPNSITSIGRAAFLGCSGLTSLFIPNSVTGIYVDSFAFCSGLESITVEEGNSTYYSNDCNAIIYKNKKGERYLLFGCKNTVFDPHIVAIQPYAFVRCVGLRTITIPSTVTSIIGNPFSYCENLESITVEEGNTTYDSREGCNAIIRTRDNSLMAGCRNTVIPATVTAINEEAFKGCKALNAITIPVHITSIGNRAFADALSLKHIHSYAPSDCITMGEDVFQNVPKGADGCTLHVRRSCVDGYRAAEQWRDLNIADDINVENKLTFAVNDDGVTATVTGHEAELYDELEIPATTVIGTESYPVTAIGNDAFRESDFLTSAVIPSGVTVIGAGAFYRCFRMEKVSIRGAVTSIGLGAFMGTSLTGVVIPASVTEIGTWAFAECFKLSEIVSKIEEPAQIAMGVDVFYKLFFYASHQCKLRVPYGSLEKYRAAEQWKDFVDIEEEPARGDVSGDGQVNGSDVTALYNVLLDGAAPAGNADVNGDGSVNGADVTVLYNQLLNN